MVWAMPLSSAENYRRGRTAFTAKGSAVAATSINSRKRWLPLTKRRAAGSVCNFATYTPACLPAHSVGLLRCLRELHKHRLKTRGLTLCKRGRSARQPVAPARARATCCRHQHHLFATILSFKPFCGYLLPAKTRVHTATLLNTTFNPRPPL